MRLPSQLFPWLALVLGLPLVVHFAWVMDDAFVYFRYVDNLLFLDHGLVYNPGEFTEGYSSPLWTLLLVPLRAAGPNWWTIVRLLGLATFLATWAASHRVQREMAPEGPAVGIPHLWFALAYGPLSSFTSGLETPLVQLLAPAYAWFLVRPQDRVPQVLVGLSPLVRHEFLVPLVLAAAWAVVRHRCRPGLPLALALASLGGWLAFRVTYYATLLPNTFALKDGTWWSQGWTYLVDAALPYHVPWLLLAGIGVGFVLRGRDRVGMDRLAMLGIATASALYTVRVGGDFLHFRTLAFPLGLAICALTGLPELALSRGRGSVRIAGTLAIALGLGTLFFTARPTQLGELPFTLSRFPYGDRAALEGKIRAREGIEDAMVHRVQPDLKFDPWGDGDALELKDQMRGAHGGPSARITSDYWCNRIYRRWNDRVVHSLGLTDPVLAHVEMEAERPGHKWLLYPLSLELAALRDRHGMDPGTYDRAVAAGDAPPWVAANLPTLRILARRMHNRHRPLENLRLALTDPGRIQLTPEDWVRLRAALERAEP